MDKIKHTITAFIQYVRRNIFSFAVLLFVPLWYFLVAPYLLMIPSDFTYKADMVSVDNFYDASIGEFGAEQYSKTDFSYEVVSYAGFISRLYSSLISSQTPLTPLLKFFVTICV